MPKEVILSSFFTISANTGEPVGSFKESLIPDLPSGIVQPENCQQAPVDLVDSWLSKMDFISPADAKEMKRMAEDAYNRHVEGKDLSIPDKLFIIAVITGSELTKKELGKNCKFNKSAVS
ncbi:MAG: hypothetical protein AAGB32_03040 [Pseudomonadota bacterium]